MLRRPTLAGATLLAAWLVTGCVLGRQSAIPIEFIHAAEPDVTFTVLKAHPEQYEGKVVIFGGAVLAEIQQGERLWLKFKNRPLDADYRPHRPVASGTPEDGIYWAVFSPQALPPDARRLARVTIVGRVSAHPSSSPPQFEAEPGPLLSGLYLRSWSIAETQTEHWEEHRDPQYLDPRGYAEPSQRHCWTCGSPYGGE